MREKHRFFIPFGHFLAIFLLLALLLTSASACASRGESQPYAGEHTHVYGHWQDAATDEGEGAKEVRYCKICHQEELRDKQ